jgi:hypothetical protein
MLIDWNTGNLYDGISASLGYEYTIDSRMLIVNSPDSTDYNKNCVYCEPHIYIFNERSKRFEEYQIKK